MTMRSITRRPKTILWWILFPAHLMPLSLFQLFLCLFQLGYTLFSKAMSMTPHYLKSFNHWPVTLLWYRISLGMALLWDTRVVWCFPRAHILNMQSFMNSMLLHQQDILGLWKHMRGHDVTSFGREWNEKFNKWFSNVLLVSATKVKLHSFPDFSNLFPSLQGFG